MSRSRPAWRGRRRPRPRTAPCRGAPGPRPRARRCPCGSRPAGWRRARGTAPAAGSRRGPHRPQHRGQGPRVGAAPDPDHRARDLDLDRRLPRGARRGRPARGRLQQDRHEGRQRLLGPGRAVPRRAAPGEQLLRAEPVPARHPAGRGAEREALGHDPRLDLRRPGPPPSGAGEDLEPVHRPRLRHVLTLSDRHVTDRPPRGRRRSHVRTGRGSRGRNSAYGGVGTRHRSSPVGVTKPPQPLTTAPGPPIIVQFALGRLAEPVRCMGDRERPMTPTRLVVGFVAGFLSVLTFQSGLIAILHALGAIPLAPWRMTPVPPFGVPQSLSAAFWGGLWGIAYALLEPRLTARLGWWLGGLAFGAVLPGLVLWGVGLALKGQPVGGGFAP